MIVCGWLQRDDDLILASGVLSWINCPLSTQASELGLILHSLHSSSSAFINTSLFQTFATPLLNDMFGLPYTSFGWPFIAAPPTPVSTAPFYKLRMSLMMNISPVVLRLRIPSMFPCFLLNLCLIFPLPPMDYLSPFYATMFLSLMIQSPIGILSRT
uniref:Uncharacterized protein n=1 Tax=Rhizophagus irregularis (strain DAOM 181602 / DAOM 197198 / MUCL 43194) TaxID=747089 RepID=U9UUU1_RHIID